MPCSTGRMCPRRTSRNTTGADGIQADVDAPQAAACSEAACRASKLPLVTRLTEAWPADADQCLHSPGLPAVLPR